MKNLLRIEELFLFGLRYFFSRDWVMDGVGMLSYFSLPT
jgi:hypothetical protein